ncbi:MAG: DNA-binding protein [Ahrensia sp.]|nr:DNA-binding protein [Ahrensia sp.]|tara:strand:- start:40667 stop:41137 length:471 start_codon:yes stop_codon:yes gene_type:complete
MAYRARRSAIKLHHNYTFEEAARVLGVSKGTVRRWQDKGLPVIADRKPFLILGGELRDFLDRPTRSKKKCRLHECYCFKCREPRAPAFAEAEFFPLSVTSGNMRALCSVCSTVMHKRVSTTDLSALKAVLGVTIRQGCHPLTKGTDPCLIEHETED